MANQFDQLMIQIKKQKEAYQALLNLSKQKREALIGQGDKSLDMLVQAEEKILLTIGDIEKKRLQIASEVAKQENIALDQLTLSTWPGLTKEDLALINTMQQDFTDILTKLDTLNEVNSKLLKVQLDYVQDMMKQVTQISESTSYNAEGGVKSRKTQENKLIDAIL